MSNRNEGIIEEFRSNDGKVGGVFTDAPLLLLHHTGARTGTKRVSPLMYQEIDGAYAVFASKGGADTNPSWFHNLKENPKTVIEIGSVEMVVEARIAEGEEREAIWERQKSDWPQFAGYEKKTARDHIPVIVLEAV